MKRILAAMALAVALAGCGNSSSTSSKDDAKGPSAMADALASSLRIVGANLAAAAPGGFPGGTPGGLAAPGGLPGGTPGGFPGGAPGGFPGGTPGGIPGGITPAPGGFTPPPLVAPAGGESVDALVNDLAGLLGEIATAIESARDVPSANAAAARIDAVTAKLGGIKERYTRIVATPEAKQAWEQKAQAAIAPVLNRIQTAGQRLTGGNPQVAQTIQAACQRFGETMQRMGN